GTLWQDLPAQCQSDTEHHMLPPYDRTVHRVSIVPDTKLYQIFGCTELAVNSYHHQAIKELGSGLQAAAVSEDGLIEGVVMPEQRFVCAVQWHPEFAPPDDAAAQKLFAAFIAAAR
ncbi:MAG: gamma-glutamyl-gamma-aminobutyrate hydrolase family protein, partial [Oscillospiraceae bacterium]|nr:gamma-glutamyl-gamma-aminobutyrate hydrolase family protein [Oscillospiraceae bacterium]